LDLPSFEDPALSSQAEIFSDNTAWEGLEGLFDIATLVVQVFSQLSVSAVILYQQPSMLIYSVLVIAPAFAFQPSFSEFWNSSKKLFTELDSFD
jgi:hypothetical protein